MDFVAEFGSFQKETVGPGNQANFVFTPVSLDENNVNHLSALVEHICEVRQVDAFMQDMLKCVNREGPNGERVEFLVRLFEEVWHEAAYKLALAEARKAGFITHGGPCEP